MNLRPVLRVDEPSGSPRAIALVLHGGRTKGTGPVRARQLAVLRMLPFARSLRRDGRGAGLAVAQLRYAVRGWNGVQQSPVADVRWALDQLADRFPGVPVALVGHSMGGRAAVYVADHENVRVVVLLAPWLEPEDPVAPLAGRRVLIAHGTLDRTTSPKSSASFARAAASVAESVSYISVNEERHAMVRRASVWHHLATGFVLGVVCDRPPSGTADTETTNVLAKALAGQTALVV